MSKRLTDRLQFLCNTIPGILSAIDDYVIHLEHQMNQVVNY